MYKVRARQAPQTASSATLSISVGRPDHEGQKLADTIGWAAARFDRINICMSDSLQRYRLQLNGMSEKDAYSAALHNGEAWAIRNAAAFDQDVPVIFTRWDWWRMHPDFADVEDAFLEAAITIPLLAQTVDKDALTFLGRNPELSGSTEALELCKRFVIEELAVHTLQAREYGSCRVYPGDQIHCLGLIRSNAIPAAPYGLQDEQFVRVGLERRPGFKRQTGQNLAA